MSAANMSASIWTYNYPAREVLDIAVAAETAGFDRLWVAEHLVYPVDFETIHPSVTEIGSTRKMLNSGTKLHDPWFLLGAVAGVTSHIRIATGVLVLPLRHPLAVARAASTACEASGGRFDLGVGAGWLGEEFAAFEVPFEERWSRLEEAIDILQASFRGGSFRHEGRHFAFDTVQVNEMPVDVPLIMAGNSDRALQRAVRLGDGWFNSSALPLTECLRLRDRIEEHRQRSGVGARRFSIHLQPVGLNERLVAQCAAEGLENIVLNARGMLTAEATRSVETTAGELRAALERLGLV